MGLVVFQHFSVLLFLLCCYSIPIAAISIDICESITKTLQADSHGYITSPNYPDRYDSDRTCPLKLVAPEGYFIAVHFLTFQLEQCESCRCDSLTIVNDITFDDSTAVWGTNHCGHQLPADIVTEENILKLYFSSDLTVNSLGFKMEFIVIPDKDEAPGINYIMGNPLDVSNSKGNISSISFPDVYPTNVHSIYHLKSTPLLGQQGYVRILFDDFQLEDTGESCLHYLKIWDSAEQNDTTLVGKFCGNQRPSAFQSTGPAVVISFFAYNNTVGRGFKLSYEFVTDVRWPNKPHTDCGAHILNPLGGVLEKHPSADVSVQTYLYYDCIWVISAPIGERILIYAQQFPIAALEGSVNFLAIHNGVTSESPVLTTEYSSWKSPVVSANNQLYIRFKAWFKSTDRLLAIYAAFSSANDGSCLNGFFFCGVSRCIHSSLVCDGFNHCQENGQVADEDNCLHSTTGDKPNRASSGISDVGQNSTSNEDPSVTDGPGVSADVMYTVSAVSVFSMMFLLVLISAKIWMNKRRQERARTRSFLSTISGSQENFGHRSSRPDIELASNASVSVTTHTGPIYINPIFEAPPSYEQIMGPVHGEEVRERCYSIDPPPYTEDELPVMAPLYGSGGGVGSDLLCENMHVQEFVDSVSGRQCYEFGVEREEVAAEIEEEEEGHGGTDTEGSLQAVLPLASLHQSYARTAHDSDNVVMIDQTGVEPAIDQSDAENNNLTAMATDKGLVDDEKDDAHGDDDSDKDNNSCIFESSALVSFYAKDETEDMEDIEVHSGTDDCQPPSPIYHASDIVYHI